MHVYFSLEQSDMDAQKAGHFREVEEVRDHILITSSSCTSSILIYSTNHVLDLFLDFFQNIDI